MFALEHAEMKTMTGYGDRAELDPMDASRAFQFKAASSSKAELPCRNIASEIRIYVRAIAKQMMSRQIFKPMKSPWDAPPEFWKHFAPKGSPGSSNTHAASSGKTRSAEFLADTQARVHSCAELRGL